MDRTESDGPWTALVLTLFPAMFPGPLGSSLAGQGLAAGMWALETVDIRAHAGDKHRTVDDAPFGGGAGLVMRPDVVGRAIDAARQSRPGLPLVYLTPRGARLDQKRVGELAAGPGVLVLCGRYEGVDERVLEARGAEEMSLGDFVLSGGEPAAIALIDACVRLLPGIVGAGESLAEESFEWGLLEYPHYTRPQEWEGRTVPEVLLSGHHERIRAWRLAKAEEATRSRRPDLWVRYAERRNGNQDCWCEGSSAMNVIEQLEKEQVTKLTQDKKVPEFRPGDTLRVDVKVIEGTRERLQAFEGVCIARRNAGLNSSFTVRKISYGEGVERVFPLYSPNVAAIQVMRRGDVRRAKLYYLRGRAGKSARIAEKTDGYSAKLAQAERAGAAAAAVAATADLPATE